MHISNLLRQKDTTLSCEVFPPKENSAYDSVIDAVDQIARLRPDFMSVTYGAGGGTSKNTVAIASHLQNTLGCTALAHLTCVASTRAQIHELLEQLKANGIENILALRGDYPAGDTPLPQAYAHANDLIAEIHRYGGFCIGGACYPEGHPENPSLEDDIERLKMKEDAGCQFLISQLYFDNDILYRYLDKLQKRGIHLPVIAGLMPVQNAKQVARMCRLSGASISPKFQRMMDKYGDNPAALAQAGIAYVTDQIVDLYANGVRGLHIYTMNKPEVAKAILQNISAFTK